MNTRELILDMLLEMEKQRTYSNILIRKVLDKYDYLPAKEKAFIKRVTEGTLERRLQIDWLLDGFSGIPVRRMKPLIRSLLRMSVYQLLFMDGIPDSAVCNEAVKLAAKRRFQSLKGYVNGVLRSIARSREEIARGRFYPNREEAPVQYLSVLYSMPENLVEMWLGRYGMERTEGMLEAMLQTHPVTIRFQESLDSMGRERLIKAIEAQGIGFRAHPYLSYAGSLTRLEGLRKVPGFEEGAFAVQDVSSMFCVECAGIREGDLILDVCAAPGGKSTHAAEKLRGTGRVIARDISLEKTELIEENAERLGYKNIEVQVFDAAVPDEEMAERADVVLADLPCSGLGILGKKRDIKYQVTEEMLRELPKVQKRILDTVWKYVKPGGTLVYSTCTIRAEENEEILRWFLENHPFEAVPIDTAMPRVPEKQTAKHGYIQFLPGIHETDGFFLAKLRRRQEPEKRG